MSAIVTAALFFALSGSARGRLDSVQVLDDSKLQSLDNTSIITQISTSTILDYNGLTDQSINSSVSFNKLSSTAEQKKDPVTEESKFSGSEDRNTYTAEQRGEYVSEQRRDSVKIWFRQSKINLVPNLHNNRENLESATKRLDSICSDPFRYRLRSVQFIGAASPEGSIRFNRWLSEQRAATLTYYLKHYVSFPDSLVTFSYLGRDWQGLKQRVLADPNVPRQDQVLKLLDSKPEPLEELKRTQAYPYLYAKHFPELRAASLVLEYDYYTPLLWAGLDTEAQALSTLKPTPPLQKSKPLCHFWMDIRSNLLYDAVLAPNIGADFYLGNHYSLGFNYKYAWLKDDSRHIYWRDYGGDLNIKYWFGKLAEEKPFQGHHVGLYAQAFTYDFEFGGKGVLGGLPGGTLLDDYSIILAADYGYSLPLTEKLNLDFCIGAGYMSGIFREYHPEDGCYVWDATKKQHYFGITKLEISLVRVFDFRYFKKGGQNR